MFIAGASNDVVYYLSDSSNPSASPTSSASPTVPEFGNTAVVMIAAVMAVTACAVALKAGKRKNCESIKKL